MKFSVTIPAYKSRYLDEAIRSVVSQTYADWELIIVDDCSPEKLHTIVAPYLADARVHYYRNERNCGAIDVVDNWNICLSYSTGQYVICMGDDDRLLPCCLEEYSKLIGQHPGLNVYHARTEIINEHGEVTDLQEQRPQWESALSLIWNRWDHRNKQYIGDFCYLTAYLKRTGGYYKLPLAWGSDDITAVQAAKEKGIANTQNFSFQYRQNALTISSRTDHAEVKMQARQMSNEWFDRFLQDMARNQLSPSDQKYLTTIEAPRQFFFYKANSQECIDYMKGNPCRILKSMNYLSSFHYTLSVFVKWYLKSLGL